MNYVHVIAGLLLSWSANVGVCPPAAPDCPTWQAWIDVTPTLQLWIEPGWIHWERTQHHGQGSSGTQLR